MKSILIPLLGILAATGIAIWALLRLIARIPALLRDVKPCRGDWAEARLRNCAAGLAATGIPVEPFNTFSSLSYLAAAWLLIKRPGEGPDLVLAGSLTLLGLGSSMYHGTKAMWGARLDHAGMYAVFGCLAIYCVAPAHPLTAYLMLGGAGVLAIGFAFVHPGDLNARMGLLLALISIRGFLLGQAGLTALSLGLFAGAFAAWLLDKRTTILGKFGHAIWHGCTAGAVAAMFYAIKA